jgi:hypothetical protein
VKVNKRYWSTHNFKNTIALIETSSSMLILRCCSDVSQDMCAYITICEKWECLGLLSRLHACDFQIRYSVAWKFKEIDRTKSILQYVLVYLALKVLHIALSESKRVTIWKFWRGIIFTKATRLTIESVKVLRLTKNRPLINEHPIKRLLQQKVFPWGQ